MANSHRAPKELAELRGDLSALKLKIVLLEKQEAELGRIEQESDSDEALQMLVKSSEQKMLRYIDRSCRKDEIKRLAFRTFPQVAKVAACLLLVCYLGLTAAIATDSTVRVRLMQFMMNIEERCTSFGFEDSGEIMNVPADWEGYYDPAYIPDGMLLADVVTPETVLYTHPDGRDLWFDDMSAGTGGALDTENATIDYITINGHLAMISEKGAWTAILWNIDNRILMINYTGKREEAIRIAESVRMIK